MSKFYLQPDISTWKTQLNPFIVTILAYDDNNIRISNKQVYAVYDITYDDTVPDLNNGQTIYSDKDGRIEFHFSGRCRISIDIYMVSEYDDTIDISQMADPSKYTCYHVCDNLIIPFEPFITDFKATYVSDQLVAVNDVIPRKYVQVLVTKSDNTTARFTLESEAYDDYIITPQTVEHIDANTIEVSYYDPILDQTWTAPITVYGKEQELRIEATYVGIAIDIDDDGKADKIQEKQLNNLVSKNEILVSLITFDGYEEKRRFLTNEEWEFVTFPQITNTNLGLFEIMRNNLRCNVKVPFLWLPADCHIDAWYEGDPVRVGEKFVPDDFRIYLYYPNHNREMILFDHCQIEPLDFVIHHTGANWFTVRYRYNNWTISDKVAIMGYEEMVYPEHDFEMLYYDPNTHSVIDVTEDFDEACQIAGNRYFNWSKILDRIKDTAHYGQYKLYAPKLTGLSTRCDTEWFITCLYRRAIDAMLIKQYLEDEEEKEE